MKPLFNSPERRNLAFRDQKTLAAALIGLSLFGFVSSEHGYGELETIPNRTFRYEVDPNSADAAELRQLPGIGEKLANAIVEDRLINGPFRTPADLRRVKGIGPKTVESLRPFLR